MEIRESQRWSSQSYAANAGFVAALGAPLLALLDPRPRERVLDLGCGDGALTAAIAARGAHVLGVDASADLLAAAAARGLAVRRMDGQALDFDADFDAVFTNAALHWMPDHDAVLSGIARALVPGGRFVGEFGGHGNVAAIVTALIAALERIGVDCAARHPWTFPTAEAWAERLSRHGFRVLDCALIPRPTPLPTGLDGWLATFANPFVAGLTDADRASVLAHAARLLAPSLRDRAGRWSADYVRLRFAAARA